MQWTGVLAAPIAWVLHMQTNYALVPWACKTSGGMLLLYVVTILALLVTGIGAYCAWRGWQEGAGEEPELPDTTLSRARFMAGLGLFISGMFFLVIIAQAVPGLFLHPCQR